MDAVIHHNPDCGSARNVRARVRDARAGPQVIARLTCPPSRALPPRDARGQPVPFA